MRPELFKFFDLGIPSYFILLFSGFLFATTSGVLWARRIGEDPDVIVDLGLSTLLMGIVGSRLLHIVADGYFWDYVHLCTDPTKVDMHVSQADCRVYEGVWDATRNFCYPGASDCFAWAKLWKGGFTYYGGFLGALVSSWYLLKRDGFPFWRAADMAGFVVPLGLAFGRMGCLLAGCCFGERTESTLGLAFPPYSPASEGQFKAGELTSMHLWSFPVHPTQIYESAASLAIAAFCLLYVHPRKRYDGQVFLCFVVLYAAARFLLEILRRDDRGGFWGLSTSQLIGVALVMAAVALHRHLRAPVPARG
ncbi:MAG TPA: prolipoprotein diacylglyceryl transferase [Polyangiaceae bacterium]|jgi:phosphatidylglycerol:prolipoprotein diacylglycerol transferase